jgi:hypothetical protein
MKVLFLRLQDVSPWALSKPWKHSCTIVRDTLLDLSAVTLVTVGPVLLWKTRRGDTGSTSTRLIANIIHEESVLNHNTTMQKHRGLLIYRLKSIVRY